MTVRLDDCWTGLDAELDRWAAAGENRAAVAAR